MYNSAQLAIKFFNYYLTASNSKGHGIHSPFVFDFIVHVLNNKKGYTPPAEIEQLRKELLASKEIIEVEDLGAGSRINVSKSKTKAEITRTALKPKKYAQLLYRLVRHYQPHFLIELGTSFGITTAYLAAANPKAHLVTIEGSSSVATVAKQNFQKLHLNNIQPLGGNFDDLLPATLQQFSSIDLVYIDGNHRYRSTMNYFNQILAKANNNTIIIFDDIHWSSEMEKAWKEIKAHSSVCYTIDVFFLGFVFFRKEFKVKQHFCIRF